MSFILHIDTNQRFDMTDKTAEQLQAELRDAGLTIGNVTVRKLLSGEMTQASGYEVVEALTEAEQNEINEALAKVETDKALETNGVDGELQGETPQPIAGAEGSALVDAGADTAEVLVKADDQPMQVETDPVDEARAAEIRNRILGTDTGTAVSNVSKAAEEKDDAALALANDALKSKANLTPESATSERTRRHTNREDLVAQARAGAQAEMIKAVEAGVVPAVYLNYMHPDQRWFEFIITETASKEKPNARTNNYIDIAPVVSGGYGFSLYVNGKSATKRQKVKGNSIPELVAAINAWLPTALNPTE